MWRLLRLSDGARAPVQLGHERHCDPRCAVWRNCDHHGHRVSAKDRQQTIRHGWYCLTLLYFIKTIIMLYVFNGLLKYKRSEELYFYHLFRFKIWSFFTF